MAYNRGDFDHRHKLISLRIEAMKQTITLALATIAIPTVVAGLKMLPHHDTAPGAWAGFWLFNLLGIVCAIISLFCGICNYGEHQKGQETLALPWPTTKCYWTLLIRPLHFVWSSPQFFSPFQPLWLSSSLSLELLRDPSERKHSMRRKSRGFERAPEGSRAEPPFDAFEPRGTRSVCVLRCLGLTSYPLNLTVYTKVRRHRSWRGARRRNPT